MMWDYGYGAWWMWIPGLLLTLLIVAGIVVLIVFAVRSSGRADTAASGEPDSAGRILDERLARGDITIEQYRELRSTLNQGRRG
ncbi:SHOCT domain-containing protein [Microbacterium invictum]|uniref:Membrane protein n=1 Tax=Microbacterium invictum TaxID=515415 RepID=A0AA40SR13_9MICO|nr:SHOCT domain-containing protein [Microbacterium invictum]MBB4140655.1 putative membrane protein [Microbacterium invictum]